jgi:ABC-type uncharacterized transport system permease subunit
VTAPSRVEGNRYRPLRLTFAVAGGAILTVGALYQPLDQPWGLFFAVGMGGLPLLGYIIGVRTKLGSIVAGCALLLLIVGIELYLAARFEVGSSTATVGYLGLPEFGFPVVLVTHNIERHATRGRREEQDVGR